MLLPLRSTAPGYMAALRNHQAMPTDPSAELVSSLILQSELEHDTRQHPCCPATRHVPSPFIHGSFFPRLVPCSECFCCFSFLIFRVCCSGELADLLDMAPSDLALRIIPAAIPKLTEDKSRDGLEALAHSVGYGLQQMMLDYGHHVVAKYLYGGDMWHLYSAHHSPWNSTTVLSDYEWCIAIPAAVSEMRSLGLLTVSNWSQ